MLNQQPHQPFGVENELVSAGLLVSRGKGKAMLAFGLDQNVSQEMLPEVWQSLSLPGTCLHHLSLKLCCWFQGEKQKNCWQDH